MPNDLQKDICLYEKVITCMRNDIEKKKQRVQRLKKTRFDSKSLFKRNKCVLKEKFNYCSHESTKTVNYSTSPVSYKNKENICEVDKSSNSHYLYPSNQDFQVVDGQNFYCKVNSSKITEKNIRYLELIKEEENLHKIKLIGAFICGNECPICSLEANFIQHFNLFNDLFLFLKTHMFLNSDENFRSKIIERIKKLSSFNHTQEKMALFFCSNCVVFVLTFYKKKKRSLCNQSDYLDENLLKKTDFSDGSHFHIQSSLPTSLNSSLLSPSSNDFNLLIKTKPPIKVLSLFDGIGTGIIALKQLGIKIDTFVASEIDDNAIKLVENWHPEVIHVGDITSLTEDDVIKLGPFDLVMAGSPCNDLSGANPRRRGLIDPKGSGCLFFDFYRILQAIKPSCYKNLRSCINQERNCLSCKQPFYWLFENVVSMKKVERERISRFLCSEPININAIEVSAAARPRFFWGNVPGLNNFQPDSSKISKLTVQDCLEPGRVAMVEKLNTITSKKSSISRDSSGNPFVMHNNQPDCLWTIEIERVFGVPPHYTDVNNLTPKERLVLLSRSWSVPVIRQILKPLRDEFKLID